MKNKEYNATVNTIHTFDVNQADLAKLDIIEHQKGKYHLIQNDKNYAVEIISVNTNKKTVELLIDEKRMTVQLTDEYDRLVKKMGLSAGQTKKINAIKAPMPGLVLDILVSEGQHVQKGDAILILEAMKMENVLKAPNDTLIKTIHVEKTNAVEKGQLLIDLE